MEQLSEMSLKIRAINPKNSQPPRPTKSVTVQDVALEAAVSKTTAASVLRDAPGFQVSDATRQRVLSTAKSLGYRRHAVATALSSGRTHTVGLILPLPERSVGKPISRIYGQDVFSAVFQAASGAGLCVTAIPQPGLDAPLRLQDVAGMMMDGVIMASLRDAEFACSIYEAGIPCVEIGSGHGTRLIHPDNDGGAELAVAHLVSLGHENLAHWRGDQGNYAAVRRREGFLAAAARHGLRPDKARVLANRKEVVEALRGTAAERPTAIFAFNDYHACLMLDIARELGLRVPHDFSIVGFDDNILATSARPQLTTVRNPLAMQAEAAIDMLQALWRSEKEPNAPQAIPTNLVVRQSTAAPREGTPAPLVKENT